MTMVGLEPNSSNTVRTRAIRALRERTRKNPALHRALGPAAESVRRLRSRIRPVITSKAPRMVLQASLLERLDLTRFNHLGPPAFSSLVSRVCSAAQIQQPEYRAWAAVLHQSPRFHRKQWEHIVVLESARQAGVMERGHVAVGFGVGTEPLPAALASFGMRVLATDQPVDGAAHWTVRNEHSATRAMLIKPEICSTEVFERLVSFRPVDMNSLPSDLGSHDLVWSSCVIEHLGSPGAGLDFVRRSSQLLRPGGVAVHTTELDLTPGISTVDYGNCALYRLDDLHGLQSELQAAGYIMDLNPYVAMEHPADRAIAPPFSKGEESFHLKLGLYDSVTTSIALIIRAPK